MAIPDRDRALPKDILAIINAPVRQPTVRKRTAPDPLSPERVRLRAQLPDMIKTKSIRTIASELGVSEAMVRNDYGYLKRRGLITEESTPQATTFLPYIEAERRARELDNVLREALTANQKLTLEGAIEVLRSKVTWATTNEAATRAALKRIRDQLGIEPPPVKRRKKTNS